MQRLINTVLLLFFTIMQRLINTVLLLLFSCCLQHIIHCQLHLTFDICLNVMNLSYYIYCTHTLELFKLNIIWSNVTTLTSVLS